MNHQKFLPQALKKASRFYVHISFIQQLEWCFSTKLYRVSINDCRVQPAMETCQILNVPLCSANNECHIFRLGCWLLSRDKFQLCFTLANINVFII
jgi:hypothetical protein